MKKRRKRLVKSSYHNTGIALKNAIGGSQAYLGVDVGKPSVHSTPIHKPEDNTLKTPISDYETEDEIFWDDDYEPDLPGFTEHKYEFKLPGFEIKEGNDLSILFKDDKGDTQFEYWSKFIEFKGNKVYQRDDLIDPNFIRPDGKGTNLEAMSKGYAPIGMDGKSLNLHHLIQTDNGAIAEVPATFHQKYTKIIHINPQTIDSGINRETFRIWRENYWKDRAKNFELKGDK